MSAPFCKNEYKKEQRIHGVKKEKINVLDYMYVLRHFLHGKPDEKNEYAGMERSVTVARRHF
jgi:hypothetical protein